ncbi:MAG: UDP-N-acetylglucosamine 2-epimerase [Flavobacteriales bacterium]|nr:UDP-N-acetylglucosamine 2-epimerase [Flavobacteriales bacterium]
MVKAAAISHAVSSKFQGRIQETLLHTGQHYDNNMSQVFFDELGIPGADIALNVGSGSHGAQTARMIEASKRTEDRKTRRGTVVWRHEQHAGRCARCCEDHIPVAHVEGGPALLQQGHAGGSEPRGVRPLLHLALLPTETAVTNLANEGFDLKNAGTATADKPHVLNCGDVMFDNSMRFAELAKERSTIIADLGLGMNGFILATVHRDNNTDERNG